MVNKSKSAIVGKIIFQIVAIVCALFFLVPFYFAFINSLRDPWAGMPEIVFPYPMHWSNYVSAVTMIPFWRYLQSSLIITGISVTLAVVMNFLFGFAFARLKAPKKEVWFTILISLMMIPEVATIIPQFTLFSNWGMLNTFWIWILMGFGGSPFYTFLYRQFLSAIPVEMEEAARIDGCSVFSTMWHIFVPLSIPVIAIVFMFEFIVSWGDIVRPMLFLHEGMWPLAGALTGNRYAHPEQPTIVSQSIQLAASFLFILPSFAVYFIGQKHVRAGMITTGLKG